MADERDEFMANTFGTHPGTYAGQNAQPDAATPGPAAEKLVLTHQTEESGPGARTRTKLGVGERVVLSVKPGPGTWLVSGAVLSSGSGDTVTLFARTPGTADVAVTVGSQSASVRFEVVAPSSVTFETVGKRHAANGLPNGAVQARIYVGPADVSFANIGICEVSSAGTASGYLANAAFHNAVPGYTPMTKTIAAGKGTLASETDQAGFYGGHAAPPWEGSCTYSIPYQYAILGADGGVFATVTQTMVSDKEGKLTVAKGAATITTKLTDGESSFAGARY